MTKTLDLNYRFLIATFVIAIFIHAANATIVYPTNKALFLIFLGLSIVWLWLVALFHHLMEQDRPRSYLQNILTLGNIIMVIGSTMTLLNYITNGL
jgi:predicted membrane channel-forming protein YqfA (hemolysin III family)